ncbi:MBL fold metallo-hydrolase [Polaromonas sp. YR568]|uniref:MBL fold metallo-hydrolase n=1 Tax=Polaromonas sp. YR568 TaxID=1855301 RepID=UPI00398BDCF4
MAKLTTFRVGHCTHPSCMVLKGSGLASRCFPSRAYLAETRAGLVLWDTGYADRFREATAQGIYRLYSMVTPVHFEPRDSLLGQLSALDIAASDIAMVVVSHFHADHMAGLRDFPSARLLASAAGWQSVQGLSGFAAVRQAFVPALVPDDISARLEFAESFAEVALPAALAPFTLGRDITGTGELFIVELPGHAAGHLGAFVLGDEGWTLLASDAGWAAESYQQLRGPSELTFLIQHQRAAYYDTLRKLHALHHGGGASIRLTHESAEDYLPLDGAAP